MNRVMENFRGSPICSLLNRGIGKVIGMSLRCSSLEYVFSVWLRKALFLVWI